MIFSEDLNLDPHDCVSTSEAILCSGSLITCNFYQYCSNLLQNRWPSKGTFHRGVWYMSTHWALSMNMGTLCLLEVRFSHYHAVRKGQTSFLAKTLLGDSRQQERTHGPAVVSFSLCSLNLVTSIWERSTRPCCNRQCCKKQLRYM